MRSTRLLALTLTAGLGLSLSACGGGNQAANPYDDGVITIGVVGTTPVNEALKEVAKDNGVDIEFKEFTDYSQVNPAQKAGEIDMNWFQHGAYLANYNNEAGDNIAPVGSTSIYPLGLYSQKHTALDQIPDGAQVAIPNDSINLSRALLLLESAGLVKFNEETTAPTEQNVDQDASKVSITPVSAEQTVLSLDSVDASVINNDFLARGNLEPEDALYSDGESNQNALPYLNLFATNDNWKDDETLQKVAGFFFDQRVLDAEKAETKGTAIPIEKTQEELQEVVDQYAEDLKQ